MKEVTRRCNEPHTRKMQARLHINVDRGQTIGSKASTG
jgi:hypothetical protein